MLLGTDIIDSDLIGQLIEVEQRPAVSLYVRTNSISPILNRERLRAALLAVEHRLLLEGEDRSAAADILNPAYSLIHCDDFWREQGRAIAIFLTRGAAFSIRLSCLETELHHVGENFHLKPLFAEMQFQAKFHLLEVRPEAARLYRCLNRSMEDVTPAGLPQLYEQAGTAAAQTTGAQRLPRGAGSDAGAETYIRKLGAALSVLREIKELPLVLTGSERLVAMYSTLNPAKNLFAEHISSSRSRATRAELQELVVTVGRKIRHREAEAVFRSFDELSDTPLVSHDVKSIVSLAKSGAIKTLIAANDFAVWGRVDAGAKRVGVSAQRKPGDRDLIDAAVRYTFEAGGFIWLCDRSAVPAKAPMAAMVAVSSTAESAFAATA